MNRLERFSAGERFAVDPDAVERELAAIWREAGTATEGKKPVTRACLWNVLVHVEERPGRPGFPARESLEATVAQLAAHLASRTLVIRTRPAKAKHPELESWISANCILAGGGGKLVCSEEITLASRGTGSRHIAGLVRALLVPGIPTALVSADPPDETNSLQSGLLDLADRLVTDLDRVKEPDFGAFARASADLTSGAMDLSWLRLARLRHEVAERFDTPGVTVDDVSGLTINVPEGHKASSLMMLGWLASGLSASSIDKTDTGWVLKKAAGDIRIDRTDGSDWGLSLQFRNERPDCVMRYEDAMLCVQNGDNIERRPQTVAPDASLIAKALTSHSQDDSLATALRLEAWR